MGLDAFGHSDTGKQRVRNEDNYLCLQLASDADVYLLAVADGMGGHVGGALASELAVKSLRKVVTHLLHSTVFDGTPADILRRGFGEANREIIAEAKEDEGLKGMGTTLVAALLLGERATIANVGDSRCYHLGAERLRQVSRDHSWRAEQLRLGELSTEDIARSPFRGMITRALGLEVDLEVDVFDLIMAPGELLLLCTDGAHGQVSDDQIEMLARSSVDAEAVCRELIRQSNEAGGIDNVTCVTARFGDTGATRTISSTRQIATVDLDLLRES